MKKSVALMACSLRSKEKSMAPAPAPVTARWDLNSKRRKMIETEEGIHNDAAHPLDHQINNKEEEEEEEEEGKTEEESGGDLPLLLRCRRGDSSCWQNIWPDILQLIFNYISSSIPDILSFSSVCTSWRSVAKSSSSSLNSISPPPLLLSSREIFTPNRSVMSGLTTLTPIPTPLTYRSPVSQSSLKRDCCGCSHGHLISADSTSVLIADLFSSAEFCLPKLPQPRSFIQRRFHITHGLLTAPPSSSSSMILLIGMGSVFFRRLWADPQDSWSVHRLSSAQHVLSTLVFNGKLHVLHSRDTIRVLEFVPNVHWRRLLDAPHKLSILGTPYMRLADCDGELLLVCFMRMQNLSICTIEVHKMDHLGSQGGAWVRIKDIGNWCLFMDYIGKCPLACRNPEKWGGKSNCIYFAGPCSERWSIIPLDGTEFKHQLDFPPSEFIRPFHLLSTPEFGQWPKPTWVYPSVFLKKDGE